MFTAVKDETDFVKPVGVPRSAAKRIGSASSATPSTTARRPMVGQRPSGEWQTGTKCPGEAWRDLGTGHVKGVIWGSSVVSDSLGRVVVCCLW